MEELDSELSEKHDGSLQMDEGLPDMEEQKAQSCPRDKTKEPATS